MCLKMIEIIIKIKKVITIEEEEEVMEEEVVVEVDQIIMIIVKTIKILKVIEKTIKLTGGAIEVKKEIIIKFKKKNSKEIMIKKILKIKKSLIPEIKNV
jgi:hypothetical protein